jgi:threonine/homoserine/homoserine lactone efflux protein
MTITLTQWLTLATVCLMGAASPGPSLTVVLSASIGGGRPAGLMAAWAHALGVALYATLTVLGATALLARQPTLFSGLQICGALYLMYLGIRLLKSRAGTLAGGSGANTALLPAARDGFAVAFLNPKLAVFMLALFSQFLSPAYGALELTLMVATAGIIDGCWYTLVAVLLTRPAWLDALRYRAGLIDRIFGLVITALAMYILADAAQLALGTFNAPHD